MFSIIVIAGIYFLYSSGASRMISVSVIGLYIFSGFIIILSLIYSLAFYFVNNFVVFAVVQIIIDTFLVSMLIFFTGVYYSGFLFFYLIIILYSSAVFMGGKPFLVAAFTIVQYGLLADLKYFNLTREFRLPGEIEPSISGASLFFQITIFMLSALLVAWLSDILAKQLKKARKDLKWMNEYVKRVERLAYAGEIAAGFAHEIKNPMASLRGALQLALSDFQSGRKDDIEKLGKIVLRETDRIDELVRNFLYFAKPGKAHKKQICPAEEIEEILKMMGQNKQIPKKIKIISKTDPDCLIFMSSDHFRQIVWNLLLNAVDAVGEEGVVVLSLSRDEQNIRLNVEDTGHGIPDEIVDKVTDPFFTTKSGGSGLGLSIVTRLLSLYDAVLYIKNRDDETGTRVEIFFGVE